MADITISDLELAPALADDMVFPVENTTDTYAATLAMLRRLINKTFVEVENADFNALTDDGFYQCTGTPTNSPVAGAINWTLQVSAESGVVVQRAFSLDDNFANLYIRRWNGVTWTGWLDVGKGALDNKANVSNTVTTDTVQTITASKNISVGGSISYARTFEIMMPTSTESDPEESKFREIAFVASDGSGERYEGSLTHQRLSNGTSYTGIRAGRLINGQYKESGLGAEVGQNGVVLCTATTPPESSVGAEIVTAGWFRLSGCTARTVIETYKSGANWYRVFSDGWIEQGGFAERQQVNVYQGVTFLKKFADNTYTSLAIVDTLDTDGYNYFATTAQEDATGSRLTIYTRGHAGTVDARRCHWYACGY